MCAKYRKMESRKGEDFWALGTRHWGSYLVFSWLSQSPGRLLQKPLPGRPRQAERERIHQQLLVLTKGLEEKKS